MVLLRSAHTINIISLKLRKNKDIPMQKIKIVKTRKSSLMIIWLEAKFYYVFMPNVQT